MLEGVFKLLEINFQGFADFSMSSGSGLLNILASLSLLPMMFLLRRI